MATTDTQTPAAVAPNSRMTSPTSDAGAARLNRYWVQMPATLLRFSKSFSAVWGDGIYLTAWPRVALWLPWIVFGIGFAVGVIHPEQLAVQNANGATGLLVVFLQSLPLVALAAVVGSLSANLGLLLAVGFAIGDYLIGAPLEGISPTPPPILFFVRLRVPLLLSYLVFLALVLGPLLCRWAVDRGVSKLPAARVTAERLRAAAAPLLFGVYVLAWTFAAPELTHIVGTWVGQRPPIDQHDYRLWVDPWLPVVAAVALLVRTWLESRATRDPSVTSRLEEQRHQLQQTEADVHRTKRVARWLPATLGLALVIAVSAGLIDSWIIGAALVALFALVLIARGVWWWNRAARATGGRSSGVPTSEVTASPGLQWYWVQLPAAVRRYTALVGASWADGVYLTAWRPVAVWLPVIVFLIGMAFGSTHYTVFMEDRGLQATGMFESFFQSLPIVFIAVLVGALSANLGFLLVLGYAAGDYLIAGPIEWLSGFPPLIEQFFRLRVALLLTYVLFFALAVGPLLSAWAVLKGPMRRFRGTRLGSAHARTAAMAVVQAIYVYSWTFAVPMLARIIWIWAGDGSSPVNVRDYQAPTIPWLPLVAGAAIGLRGWLEHHAYRRPPVAALAVEQVRAARQADRHPGATRRLPAWLTAVLRGALMTLLTTGMVYSWIKGGLMLAAFIGLMLVRAVVLPRLGAWVGYARRVSLIPVGLRVLAVTIATTLVSRFIVGLQGQLNGARGDFGMELLSIVAGVVVAMIVLVEGSFTPEETAGARAAIRQRQRVELVARTAQAAAGVCIGLVLTPRVAQAAGFCNDPSCCMENFWIAAFVIVAVVLLATGVLALMALGGAELISFGATMAAAEEAAAAAELAASEALTAEALLDSAAAEAGTQVIDMGVALGDTFVGSAPAGEASEFAGVASEWAADEATQVVPTGFEGGGAESAGEAALGSEDTVISNMGYGGDATQVTPVGFEGGGAESAADTALGNEDTVITNLNTGQSTQVTPVGFEGGGAESAGEAALGSEDTVVTGSQDTVVTGSQDTYVGPSFQPTQVWDPSEEPTQIIKGGGGP